jgi:hypothetical protein
MGDGEGEPKLDPELRRWLVVELIDRLGIQEEDWTIRESSS